MVTLDLKDLAKYPFLKESQTYIGAISSSLEHYLESTGGRVAIREAMLMLEHALSFSGKETPSIPEIPPEKEAVMTIIATYPVSRIMVSCAQDRMLIERLVRYQAWVVFAFLQDEEPEIKRFIRRSIGLPETGMDISVIDYIPVASRMAEERWRLVNRVVEKGKVRIRPEEYDEIVRERLRYIMSRNLPLKVPSRICDQVKPAIERIKAEWQKKVLEEFGQVEESAFPPCMQAILGALTGHGHLTHMARFAVTAFLHNIGMDNTRIIELYGSVPNFDLRKTLYQVEHISGRGGTSNEYISPLCATMRTHGICVHPDSICSRVTHPLSYYKLKKRDLNKQKYQKQVKDPDESMKKRVESEGDQSDTNTPDCIPSSTDNKYKDEKST
ncbi:DNA primase regulatory subunit PriL [Methanospirillum stamsii]|uniref:DNA primase large subunit PriL n=2 Tax=Methanospirillum stamsii TaxID=1277351 RepID=A0A2V2N479_9EURY|nr:DNA primase regulatory subunit PriL [Methanospirillum stamsii]PWR74639.1 DNA primase regulatory subunit PriL [Methanospirillum stamsii]